MTKIGTIELPFNVDADLATRASASTSVAHLFGFWTSNPFDPEWTLSLVRHRAERRAGDLLDATR